MRSLLSINGFIKDTVLILIIMLSATSFINVSIAAIELAYDDCGAEGFWSDYYPNGMAVKFSPPASRWRITAILVYGFMIDRGEKPFVVEIRDGELNVILRVSLLISEYFKNATLHWAKVPLPNVIVKGDFYVCVYPMLDFSGTQLWIAMDNDTAPDRCFMFDCYKQEVKGWRRGHAMIRVEGGEAIDLIEIIPDSIFVEEKALRLSFRVVAPSNVTEFNAVLQTESLAEDCEVTRGEELYGVIVNWTRLSGLKEPAKLKLRTKASNSTTCLTIKLSQTFLSTLFRLKDENALLRTILNSSDAEQEVLKHKIENGKMDVIALRSLLTVYEEKLLNEESKNEKLLEELNTLRLLTTLLAVSTLFLLAIVLRRRLFQFNVG
ncbi:MAG: hypothetical protein N3F08_00580 [Crenarchaeota archaeon]|nr:hypothetical protein [Thermoproteota archaeon]